MKKLRSTPISDGFFMPAEFEEHEACIMIWPERPGSFSRGALFARQAFAKIAIEISESERVIMLVSERSLPSAEELLPKTVEVQLFDSDDAWARDTAPIFVKNREGLVRGVNFSFNAWGGKYDGLYPSWEKDDALALSFCERNGYGVYDASHFVLEGGSIHSDGEGTLLVTEACLMSPGRNPSLSKGQIEQKLKTYLGAQKIIWLPHGIYNDETNEHVDNICAFVRPGEVVLAWTDKTSDPQFPYSQSCYEVLSQEKDAHGRSFQIHKLPIPDNPVCITKEDLSGLQFDPGEDRREEGERLAASYVNFFCANHAILCPVFGEENIESDSRAIKILSGLYPERKVVPVDARAIIVGGGNIHCITQQIPKGAKSL